MNRYRVLRWKNFSRNTECKSESKPVNWIRKFLAKHLKLIGLYGKLILHLFLNVDKKYSQASVLAISVIVQNVEEGIDILLWVFWVVVRMGGCVFNS